jgi:thioredoxin reductase (NADPH)
MSEIRNLCVLGSGPAGLTAAIYASRAGLAPLVIEGMSAGGQLMTTTEVDNFPGFPDGIDGPTLIAQMRKQAERFGTEFHSGDAVSADLSKRPFKIQTDTGVILTRTLIIATGAEARIMDIPSVQALRGRGVSACATCDGFFFKDKTVFMIGGGDSAMEEAIFLTRFAKEVFLVHRRDELRASKIMQDHAKANPKITFLLSHVLIDALGVDAGRVTGVKLKDLKSGVEKEMPADGLFFAVGHDPSTKIFKDSLELNPANYLKTLPDKTATKIEGVFAAGDVHDDYYRQAITAAGEGCKAALEAERFLSNEGI